MPLIWTGKGFLWAYLLYFDNGVTKLLRVGNSFNEDATPHRIGIVRRKALLHISPASSGSPDRPEEGVKEVVALATQENG